ncbi:MAG: hypothetical protein QM778_27765 [Myxococcales bacterium]
MPSFRSLPDLPVALAGYADQVASIEVACERPTGTTLAEINTWMQQRFIPWLRDKSSAVMRMERELTAVHNVHARPIIAALIGHMHEDVADDLLSVPVPSELIEDAELTAVFRQSLIDKAMPSLQKAKLEYTACTPETHSTSAEREAWGRYCKVRVEVLDRVLAEAVAPPSPKPTIFGMEERYGIRGVWTPPPDAGVGASGK